VKIFINDHAGHPFQVQLSRYLAKRKHVVLHTYTAELQTPRGILTKKKEDHNGLAIQGIPLKRPFDRYGTINRFLQERELGRALEQHVLKTWPNVMISANTPLGAQDSLLKSCEKTRCKFVFWLQDLLGVGIRNNLKKKLPVIGDLIGQYYIHLEKSLLAKSDAVVTITDDFVPILNKAGVSKEKIHVIHNWAPLEELPRHDKANNWSLEHSLDDKFCFLYTGTLGMKHNPNLLLKLALSFQGHPDIRLVVITEGMGADYLKEKKIEHSLENLVLMPFQSFENLPMVLASADVLLAILEPDAGVFAVPSKVLTYLCAERPLLLAVPFENLAARIVKKNEAGICVGPDDIDALIKFSEKLVRDGKLRERLGKNARKYAENTFNIEKITDKFEGIFDNLQL